MNGKKKILLDLERLRYPNSGIANVFRHLAKGLERLDCNIEIDIYGPMEKLSKEFMGFEILERKSWHKIFAPFVHNYGIVHVSHQLSRYFWRNNGKAVKIVTLHDLNFLYEDLNTEKREKIIGIINNNLKYADHIVCISHFVEEDFKRNIKLFNLKKLKSTSTIHNGLDFDSFKFDAELPSELLKNVDFILNIGVLFPKKKQLRLVEMLPYIKEDLVLVVSDSKLEYEEKILQTAENLGVAHRLYIVRNISNDQKFALLQNCVAYCHPSIAEGFGIPPIEAMFYGKPVFLSKMTSLPEIGGEYAYYFDELKAENMAETFKEGMENYNVHPELKDQITKWALQYDYRETAKKYLALYDKVLNS